MMSKEKEINDQKRLEKKLQEKNSLAERIANK